MCGAPKPPKPSASQLAAEKDAAEQRRLALEEQRAQKSELKRQRFESLLAAQGMKYGRASLLSGGKGGAGFAAPLVRSLLGS